MGTEIFFIRAIEGYLNGYATIDRIVASAFSEALGSPALSALLFEVDFEIEDATIVGRHGSAKTTLSAEQAKEYMVFDPPYRKQTPQWVQAIHKLDLNRLAAAGYQKCEFEEDFYGPTLWLKKKLT